MKINYMSDLHLNFGELKGLPGGEVLIIAGDTCEAGHIRQAINERKNTFIYDRYKEFFHEECAKYNQVFYVFGNHEYYGDDYACARERIQSILPANVLVLEDEFVNYKGVWFYGACFWTDMDKGNPLSILQANAGMSDYREIKHKHKIQHTDSYTSKFTASETVYIHKNSLKKMKEFLELHRLDKVVVITHMAPHALSLDPKYEDHPLNYAYYSDQINLILDNPSIKAWIHGHIHTQNDYHIGSTRVLANPRGYYNYEDLADRFSKETYFEV